MTLLHSLFRVYPVLMTLTIVLSLTACGNPTSKSAHGPEDRPVIRISSKRIGKSVPIVAALCAEFEKEANCRVEFFHPDLNVSDMLGVLRQYLEAQSPDLDVYDLDVIWPSILAEHLVPLNTMPGFDPKDFVPSLIQNNTVGGRIVAVPWYVDMGFLYVRRDLMDEAGTTVPKTYDDLPAIALAFERLRQKRAAAGQDGSWPYPLLANLEPQEGMTCIALEWLHAYGAGTVTNAEGEVTLDPVATTGLLTTATTWIGTAFPPTAPGTTLAETQQQFEEGKVAMMRNWTHAYALVAGSDAPLRDRVEVHPLPLGPAGRYHVLGGFQFGVSKYSKHPKLAKQLIAKLTGVEAQRRHAIEGGFFPTRPALWRDPEVMAAIPHLRSLTHTNAVEELIVRPSAVSGSRYNELSSSVFEEFHRTLTKTKTPQQATVDMLTGIRTALRR